MDSIRLYRPLGNGVKGGDSGGCACLGQIGSREQFSSAQVVLAAAMAVAAVAALVQMRSFLLPGLRIAAGFVLLEMGLRAVFDALPRPTSGPAIGGAVLPEVGESAAAGVVLS